ncbi:hypothetical protein RJ639_045333 [Escallonia herrerae]|uniref:Glycosyltransferase n=1 Tax=Escallonia herrerae TaxID=1293975 RepID=A0AA88W5Q0_9ASTE|nr:hypothetical protein RJ639_045333 [Escallonia herrerae]
METGPNTGHHIVAMPYPGRGHINPMINLCALLASKGSVTITLVVTEEWLGLLGSPPDTQSIRLRCIPNVVPSEHDRAADFAGFFDAVFTNMEAPFDRFLDQLETPASCLVADTLLPWMTSVGSRRNIPVVSVWIMAPAERQEDIIDYLPGVSSMHLADLPSGIVSNTSPLKRMLEAFSSFAKAKALVFTTFYDLQPDVVDALRAKLPIPVYSIGPAIPYFKLPPPKPVSTSQASYFRWLDSQPKSSVLYVSMGSFLSASGEQMNELSKGLRASGYGYLWVARAEAVEMLEDPCGENGLIVPWCDQLRVLCHPSIGGFVTHCGWNSTMESIFAGVPMLTFPLFFDQYHNAKLIVEDWKVGLTLKLRTGAATAIGRDEISKTLTRLMDLDGEENKELRRSTKELQEICHNAIKMGGPVDDNITAFLENFAPRY